MSAKRRLFSGLVLIMGLLSVSLGGCGNRSRPLESVSLAFGCPEPLQEAYGPLVDAFNETYPDVTVEFLDQGEYLNSGDLFLNSQYSLNELTSNGGVLALDPYVTAAKDFDRDDFYPGLLEAFTRQGKLWAVPASADPIMIFYNRALFDEAGVSYPTSAWTDADFLEAAQATTDVDAQTFGYVSTPHLPDASIFVYQQGGRLVDDLQDPTRVTFDEPATIEAVTWYADLVNRHDVAPTPRQRRVMFPGQQGVYQGILEERAAMWMGYFSERGGRYWPIEWFDHWGMVPLPRHGQSLASFADTQAFFISADAEDPDAVWVLIDFLSEQSTAAGVPARRSVVESDQYAAQVGDEIAVMARAAMDSAVVLPADVQGLEAVFDAFDDAVAAILRGDASPAEALSEAQQAAEAALGP